MKTTRKTARQLNLGDKLLDLGEVCGVHELHRGVDVRVVYRDAYTPPDANKHMDVNRATQFIVEEMELSDLVREAIDRLQDFQHESLYALLLRKQPYVTTADWVFTMQAHEFVYSIGQMIVEAHHTPTDEKLWLGVWSDGPRADYEIYETQAECVQYFISNLTDRARDEGEV